VRVVEGSLSESIFHGEARWINGELVDGRKHLTATRSTVVRHLHEPMVAGPLSHRTYKKVLDRVVRRLPSLCKKSYRGNDRFVGAAGREERRKVAVSVAESRAAGAEQARLMRSMMLARSGGNRGYWR
jgi:hypothetical protein